MTDNSHNRRRCSDEPSSAPSFYKANESAVLRAGVISMLPLLLFDTHAGGNLTFYSFRSHLRDFMRGFKTGKARGIMQEECVFVPGCGGDHICVRLRWTLRIWGLGSPPEGSQKRHVDSIYQDFPGLLDVSRVLFTWMRLHRVFIAFFLFVRLLSSVPQNSLLALFVWVS